MPIRMGDLAGIKGNSNIFNVDFSLPLETMLCKLQANLVLLYIKSKNYHWNVEGTGFHGVHKTFDKLQDYASDQSDRIAERMRYRGYEVYATASNYLKEKWYDEGIPNSTMEIKLTDICVTLDTILGKLTEYISNSDSYPVEQNMMQDIHEGLGKFKYFLKSSLPKTND